MRDMAYSICLMKLYQITMRKKFRFFVSDDHKAESLCTEMKKNKLNKLSKIMIIIMHVYERPNQIPKRD